ncbi:hypothetical protein BGZ51_007337, partial [Haplosporangium sp. Z 767]
VSISSTSRMFSTASSPPVSPTFSSLVRATSLGSPSPRTRVLSSLLLRSVTAAALPP